MEQSHENGRYQHEDHSDEALQPHPDAQALPTDDNDHCTTVARNEKKYRTIVEHLSDGICIVRDDHICFVNRRLASLLGYTPEEMRHKRFSDFFDPAVRQMGRERFVSLENATAMHERWETVLTEKSGHHRSVELACTAITYDEHIAVLTFVRDISEKQTMDEELQKIRKLESIGTLAGGLAHDFNNILTAILGNINFALMSQSNHESIHQILKDTEKACLQAMKLTGQLLTFSKGSTPKKSPLHLDVVVPETARFALRGTALNVSLDIHEGIWQVEADEAMVNQVINNLLINAVQAMPGGGTIHIIIENCIVENGVKVPIKRGNYVKVTIKDSGPGIPEKNLKKIFEPFFTTKENGSGLGLAISYSIMVKHNGSITVDSQVGVGSSFSLYFPANGKNGVLTVTVETVKDTVIKTGRNRILIMDDDAVVQRVTGNLLSVFGFEVSYVNNGLEAVSACQEALDNGKPYHVVIMDLVIPGSMGAVETLQRLLAIDSRIKAIVSSGYSNDPVMVQYKEYGFSGCITKPYRIEDITKALYQAIS